MNFLRRSWQLQRLMRDQMMKLDSCKWHCNFWRHMDGIISSYFTKGKHHEIIPRSWRILPKVYCPLPWPYLIEKIYFINFSYDKCCDLPTFQPWAFRKLLISTSNKYGVRTDKGQFTVRRNNFQKNFNTFTSKQALCISSVSGNSNARNT